MREDWNLNNCHFLTSEDLISGFTSDFEVLLAIQNFYYFRTFTIRTFTILEVLLHRSFTILEYNFYKFQKFYQLEVLRIQKFYCPPILTHGRPLPQVNFSRNIFRDLSKKSERQINVNPLISDFMIFDWSSLQALISAQHWLFY